MQKSNKPSYDELLKRCTDLKQKLELKEDRIRILENERQRFQEITKIGTWHLDLKTNEVEWSEELYKMYGFDLDQPIPLYNEHKKLFTKESWELLSKSLDKTANTGIAYELELRTVRKDGSYGWIWVRGEAVKNSSNEIIGLWGAAQDITPRRQIQEELEQRERLLNEMGEMAKVGGWQIDLKRNELTWTKEVYKIHEVDKSFIPTVETGINFYSESSKAVISEALDKAIQFGASFNEDLEIISAKGSLVKVRAIGKIIFDEKGKPELIYGSFQDITRQKTFEEQLISTKEEANSRLQQLETIQLNVSNILWKWDIDKNGNLSNVYISDNVDEFLALPKGSINSSLEKFFTYIYPEYIPQVEEAINSIIKNHNEHVNLEYKIKRADGKLAWFSSSGKAIIKNRKTVVYGSTIDITVVKEREKELLQAKEKAELVSGRLQAALESMTDAVFISDLDGNFIEFNETFATFHRFKSKSECAKTFEEYPLFLEVFLPDGNIVAPKDWVVNKALRGDRGVAEEYILKRKDSGESWLGSYSYSPIRDSKKNIVGSVVTARDITSARKAETDLLESRTEFETWIQNAPLCTKKIDLDFNLQFMSNAGIKELKVDDVNELYGKPYPFYFFPEPIKKKMFATLVEVKQSVEARQVEGVLADTKGNRMWYNHILVPVKNTKGELDYILIISTDITSQKKAQQEMISAKEKALRDQMLFSALYHESPDMYVSCYSDTFEIFMSNKTLSKKTNYSSGELIGKSIFMLFSGRGETKAKNYFNRLSSTKAIENKEVVIVDKDGADIHVSLNAVLLQEKNGRPFILSSLRDISERIKLRNELNRDRKLLNETGRLAKIGGWEFDVEKNAWYFTDELAKLYGIKKNARELRSMDWIRHYPASARKQLEKSLNNAIEKIKSFELELPFNNQQVGNRWLRVTGFVEKKSGKVVRIVGVVKDITARRKAEQINNRMSEAIERSPNSIILTDSKGVIEYVNPAFESVTGYHKSEVIGNKPSLLSSGFHDVEFYKQLWNSLKSQDIWIGEFYNKRKNGEFYWESASISAVYDKYGNLINYLAIKEDITDSKNLISELQKAKEKAEEADKLKSAFLANMSHEIRTPMNGIIGFTELLQSPNLSEGNIKQFSSIIKKSSERLLNTVNDIVEISKIESGVQPLRISKANILPFLNNFITFYAHEAKSKNLELQFKTGNLNEDLVVNTDEGKLTSVISNLLKNAIKYTETGYVEFGAKHSDNQLVLYCKDTGIGIPKDRQKAIFNRFEQADIADSRAFEGSGLGLAIVKSYVEMLDGKIWVESEVNVGSTFYVSLPCLAKNLNKEEALTQVKTGVSSIKNLKVLIAEDDDISAMHISLLAKELFKSHKIVGNGIEAVEHLKKDPTFDLVLMDIKMPLMDGYEAVKIIREFNNDIRIIAQTAFAFEEDKNKVIEAGFNCFISKPIQKNILIDKVSKCISKTQRERGVK